MAKAKTGVIIIGVLLLVVVLIMIKPTGDFVITGSERMSRNVPSLINAGSTFNVEYSVTGVSGNWAATVVDTLV